MTPGACRPQKGWHETSSLCQGVVAAHGDEHVLKKTALEPQEVGIAFLNHSKLGQTIAPLKLEGDSIRSGDDMRKAAALDAVAALEKLFEEPCNFSVPPPERGLEGGDGEARVGCNKRQGAAGRSYRSTAAT